MCCIFAKEIQVFFMSSIRDFAQIDLIVNGKEAVAELDRTRKKVQA